ncbi:MAG: hypothetical protein QXJ06_01940 [Candidatus Aenigmatarchaeota archaeon]
MIQISYKSDQTTVRIIEGFYEIYANLLVPDGEIGRSYLVQPGDFVSFLDGIFQVSIEEKSLYTAKLEPIK